MQVIIIQDMYDIAKTSVKSMFGDTKNFMTKINAHPVA